MSYILDLRKEVGHRTLLQCAASIICVDEQGRVLLGLRSDNNMWGYSGGSVELDEKVEDCARRELLEEMGLKAHEIEFFYINSGAETHYTYPNGDEVSNVEIVYLCRNYEGVPRCLDGEMLELKFFKPEEINLEDLVPPIRPVMREYLKRRKIDVDSSCCILRNSQGSKGDN
ncbi:MAG: NUDIX domain-containing protein [Sphaerochaetaceae bacterium]|nr:NUDIX domain-containing protein [Sphaerochaetaceae bacterium]